MESFNFFSPTWIIAIGNVYIFAFKENRIFSHIMSGKNNQTLLNLFTHGWMVVCAKYTEILIYHSVVLHVVDIQAGAGNHGNWSTPYGVMQAKKGWDFKPMVMLAIIMLSTALQTSLTETYWIVISISCFALDQAIYL